VHLDAISESVDLGSDQYVESEVSPWARDLLVSSVLPEKVAAVLQRFSIAPNDVFKPVFVEHCRIIQVDALAEGLPGMVDNTFEALEAGDKDFDVGLEFLELAACQNGRNH